MASEFDRRIALILEHEKFNLLTSGIGDKTRDQYMTCWRRWAQYSACVGSTPWVREFSPGWDVTLLDFLAWRRKILGLQHSALAKSFYAIRYIHIVDGLEDISLRAHRVRCLIKSVTLRSKTYKKVPPNTDFIRWVRCHL